MVEIEEYITSVVGNNILSRVTQLGKSTHSKQIFWLVKSTDHDLTT